MSTRRVVLPGVIIGVILLALAVVFAIVLPKATGEHDAITLPDTLPGGYTATDLPAAFEGAQGAESGQVDAAVRNEKAARDYGNKSLEESGVNGATRTYVGKDLKTAVIVQAFRAPGGAFSPFQFSDPRTAQAGESVEHLVKQGDSLCIERGQADGKGGVQTSYVECQRSEGDLTIQVTSPLALDKTADLVDDIWERLS